MNCKNCGSPITNEEKFCKKCGASTIVEEKVPLKPNVDPSVLSVKPMGEPTNEFAKLAKPEDHKTLVVKNTSPILLIIVFLIALAIGFFVNKYFFNDNSRMVSFKGYNLSVPTTYNIDYQEDVLYLTNDNDKVSINILDVNYNNIKTDKTIDNYKYVEEKTIDDKKYQLFTNNNDKIVIMPLSENKVILMVVTNKENIDNELKILLSFKENNTDTVDNKKMLLDLKQVFGEEENTADIDESLYEETYVEISLDEINE